ncbi:hypothetical protein [Klebsiella pneumoniae ISC21]|nr:hypothetical protein [Klebsiella pneumoniae ISC21]
MRQNFGGAIAMPLIVWMIYTFDWRLTFLIIGSVGIFMGYRLVFYLC